MQLALTATNCYHSIERYSKAHPNLSIYPIKSKYASHHARQKAVAEAVLAIRPDLVVTWHIGDAYGALSVLKKAGTKLRWGLCVRSMEPQYFADAKEFRGFIDGCFTSGALIRRLCIDWAKLEQERVFSIPGGVRAPVVPVSPRRPSTSGLRLGYVGRIAQTDKRVFDLVPLVGGLLEKKIDFELSIVGSGPQEVELKSALEHLPTIVKFYGWMTNEELYRAIYPSLDCILNFSPTEGATISPREGMIHGAVPVISRFPGLRMEGIFIEGFNSLTFPVGDVSAAVQRVSDLCQQAGLLERLSSNALESQSGSRLFEGSIDEWVAALDCCMEFPIKVGDSVPRSRMPSGRLERFGLPPRLADFLRHSVGRTPQLRDAGSEWPHGWICVPENHEREIMSRARELDA